MINLKHLPSIFGLLILVGNLFGQKMEMNFNLITSFYSIDNGISHKQVNQSFQDSRGLLWLTTPNGLNVFDGQHAYHAAYWQYLSKTREALIRAEDRYGLIWLSVLNEGQPRFRLFDIQTRKERAIISRMDTVLVGSPVDVAITTEAELLVINNRAELWKEDGAGNWLKIASSLGKFNRFTGTDQTGAHIWLTTDNTLKFEPRQIEIVSVNLDNVWSKPIQMDDFLFFSNGPDKSIIIYGKKEMTILHSEGRSFKLSYKEIQGGQALSDYYFFANYDTKNQYLWLWSKNILRVFKPKHIAKGKPNFELLAASELAFSPTSVSFIHGGALTLSSMDGIAIVEIAPNYFINQFQNVTPNSPRSQMREARGLFEASDGSIYYSIGLNVYHKPRNTSEFYQVPAVKNPGITYIAQDPSNHSVWFGGLSNYDPISRESKHFFLPDLKEGDITWTLAFLDSNSLLLGTSNGLIEFSKKTGTSSLFNNYNGFVEIKNTSVFHISKQESGKWWILAENGLYIYEPDKGITAKYGYDARGANYLPVDNFRHYFRDADGVVWFATAQGLLKWETSTGKSTLLNTTHGLPTNNLYAVYGDKGGHLWISSDRGIIRYLPKTGGIRIFLEEDGIQNNEFNRIAHLQDKIGTLYFGGINGVTVFNPDNLHHSKDKKSPYKVSISSVKVFEADGIGLQDLTVDYYNKGEVLLPSGNHFLQFDLSFANYQKPRDLTFRYNLSNSGGKWIYTRSPQVQLLGIGPGKYNLLIEAISGSGRLSDNSLSIPIRILPPFYLNPWFLFLCIIILFVVFYAMLKHREKSLKAQQILLEEKILASTHQISLDKALIEHQAELLRYQNKMQRRFFANITHEFKTPLSLVIGPIEILQKQSKLSPRFKSILSVAGNNSKRLMELVDTVLAISSLDAHQFHRRDEPTQITALFFMLAEEYTIAAGQKEITLHAECEFSAGAIVRSDQKIFRIILNNLVSNSIKFTPAKGSIWIKLAPVGSDMVLTVKDSGRGIHPEDMSGIFDRYFQTSRSDAPLEGGTGIGLSLVKELLALLNGTITVESELGKGTLFTLHLPLDYATEKGPILPTLEDSTASSNKKKYATRIENSILLVEDNPDYRLYLDFLLCDYFQLHFAANGREALEKLSVDFIPDLIITDWMMPEMDGFQLAEHLKSNASLLSIPLIFLTARSAPENISQVLRLGVDDYLVKPVAESTLLASVRTILKRCQLRKSIRNSAADIDENSEHQALHDRDWLIKLEMETLNGLSNEHFSVDILATRMLMGRSSFYRKVKALTGLTPNEYILEVRLVTARQLMESRSDLTLKKVVQMVGLKAKHNFSKAFQERFGHPPTWYLG